MILCVYSYIIIRLDMTLLILSLSIIEIHQHLLSVSWPPTAIFRLSIADIAGSLSLNLQRAPREPTELVGGEVTA